MSFVITAQFPCSGKEKTRSYQSPERERRVGLDPSLTLRALIRFAKIADALRALRAVL
jgi:hypothetical protein